jgi:hypothetical protein
MFNDQFFADLGLTNVDPETKQKLTKQLGDLTQQRLSLRLADELSDEQLDKFEEISSSKGEEASFDYVREQLPNFDQIVNQVAAEVKTEFAANLSDLLSVEDESNKAS